MLLTRRTVARAAHILFLAAACNAPHHAFADVAIGTACPGGAAGAQAADGNNTVCVGGVWQYPAYQFGNTSASCNSTNTGIVKYTGNHSYLCNGSAWTQLYEVPDASSVTAPSGNGYFVLTNTTYNGNLGDLAGADAKCLTELATTSTGWRGYSTANSNGQLVAGNVHAFVCGSVCNTLLPLVTYYFANAGNGAAGGASFTIDSSGLGPGDSNNWSAASYFSSTTTYWTGRGNGTNTLWTNSMSVNCTNFMSSSSGATSRTGVSANTDSKRWLAAVSPTCNNSYPIICYVDP